MDSLTMSLLDRIDVSYTETSWLPFGVHMTDQKAMLLTREGVIKVYQEDNRAKPFSQGNGISMATNIQT